MPDSVEYWLASGIVGWSSPSTAALCEVVEYDGKTAGRRWRFRHLEKRVGWKKKTTALTRRFPEIYWLAIHRMAGKYSGRKKKNEEEEFRRIFSSSRETPERNSFGKEWRDMELCSRWSFHPEPSVSGFENRTGNKRWGSTSFVPVKIIVSTPAAKVVAGRECVNGRRGEVRRPVKIQRPATHADKSRFVQTGMTTHAPPFMVSATRALYPHASNHCRVGGMIFVFFPKSQHVGVGVLPGACCGRCIPGLQPQACRQGVSFSQQKKV